ncbi:KpsF/GutQ family sugar-phosphate isomerase [Marinomonas balearica]|uniref:Arabinose 5-phosphate isomerase n=1 Tax=Marinomonas balearica TaxID=491947 RepID=A0A4R6M4G5_9GAMM|nr:KpsF/GutQ family sugar-phosphate isomerase [Marinomonas balearica]TDO96201.1 arabinose-5-phosphate isomerase [Marinomonas balearica]
MNPSSQALRLSDDAILDSARITLDTQAKALTGLSQRISNEFSQAVKMILATTGRVIVCGMGKSGLIGKKIAATLASTGTPSFFLHPGEAFHGDLGMIQQEDLVLLISYSGETEEVIRLLPSLSNFGNPLIAIAGNPSSTLATHCQCFLNIAVDREACPNNLAPTTSTTLTAAVGDALAVALMECRDFQPQDFARFHPGGSLGRKLLTRVKDLMHKENLPTCPADMPLSEAISVMTAGRMGVVLIQDNDRIEGIFTDGDLRRALLKKGENIMSKPMSDLMTATPKTIHQDVMIVEAEERMIDEKITLLVVVNDSESVVGLLEIYDR